jgi:hypothetical protein
MNQGTVVITGASAGIGRATAELFGRQGDMFLVAPTPWAVVADQGASMPDPSSFDLVATFIKIVFVVFGLLFVLAIVRGVIYAPRRRKILRDAGLNPMTASAQLEAKLASSALLAPAAAAQKTVEERLADLESLHGRGLISSEELHAARAKVLAG